MSDEIYMRRALELAKIAYGLGEVPVGAVIVIDSQIVAEGFNRRELLFSPLAHAEMMAIHHACQKLSAWRLLDARIYSTLEPCLMCVGALLHARVKEVIYAASDKKFGAVQSLYTCASDPRLNHQIKTSSGLMEEESVALLQDFFKSRRLKPKGSPIV
jgi:tRNA(adenine34) deaminase